MESPFFRRNETIKSKYIRNVSTNAKHADKLKPFTASTELSTFTTSPTAHFSTLQQIQPMPQPLQLQSIPAYHPIPPI